MKRARLAAALAIALAAGAACRRGGETGAVDGARRYTVRGQIVQLPEPPGRELLVRHEAIPDFADEKGKTVGMQAMTMPFPVDAGVPLAGVDVGDKVRFRFRMDWKSHAFAIESLEELPADTRLDFGGGAGR